MFWNVWIVDCIENTCEIVLESVSIQDAKDYQSVWKDKDSLVVILPLGFEVCQV